MNSQAPRWLAGISLIFAGCVTTPDSYSIPEQHAPFQAQGVPVNEFVIMDHPDAPKSFVKDIVGEESGAWRWTGPEPELRFVLSSAKNRTLIYEFVIHEHTFKDTGPVTVSFYVNDHLAGQETYKSEGDKVFEKGIPAEWLRTGSETRVRARVHPTWRTPTGDTLGILLKRVGLVE